jgi:PPK2 family polyphosphate:nucleotide phosphotransferase
MNFSKLHIVEPGTRVRLDKIDPAGTAGLRKGHRTRQDLEKTIAGMDETQYLLYADGKHALLVILQAMDAGGKDGTIRHVMCGLNPQGVRVTSFKVPTAEELAHDFLWRIGKAVPRIGEIGIFNRSQYEDVLVVRVHRLVPESVWFKRYEQINNFERLLADSNLTILKFFLHISKEEQKRRLKMRLATPTKRWKLSASDFEERKRWPDYMRAYEDALSKCSTRFAPWFIIPADHKWYRNLAVSHIVLDALKKLNLKYPKPSFGLGKYKMR